MKGLLRLIEQHQATRSLNRAHNQRSLPAHVAPRTRTSEGRSIFLKRRPLAQLGDPDRTGPTAGIDNAGETMSVW